MRNWLRAFWRRWFGHAPAVASPAPIGHNRPPKTETVNREDEGAHFYLKDVLIQIKMLHRLLRKLKSADAEAYGFQGRLGARVLPHKALIGIGGKIEHFPSAGMVYMYNPHEETRDWVPAAFIYFTKVKKPIGVEAFDGPCYRISAAHCLDGHMVASSFHIGIRDGRAVPLRCINYERGYIKGLGGRYSVVLNKGWGPDRTMLSWWQDRKRREPDLSLDEFINDAVAVAFNGWAVRGSDELQVRVRRGRTTAMLSVCTKRTPYFFKDRETTIAADGKRKRIFHIVREHERTLADGRIITVPEHYRGERRFKWDGADVTITVPGLHHAPVESMTFASEEFDDTDPIPTGMLTSAEAGRRISDHMS